MNVVRVELNRARVVDQASDEAHVCAALLEHICISRQQIPCSIADIGSLAAANERARQVIELVRSFAAVFRN